MHKDLQAHIKRGIIRKSETPRSAGDDDGYR